MLNELIFSESLDQLKNVLLHDITLLHVALAYVITYVIYKALGRYIYFKPEEHASKINRTFLALSLLVILVNSFGFVINNLPFLLEYRWFFAGCGLIFFLAPLSIIMDRIVWKYENFGYKSERYRSYLPIGSDYYKTTIYRSERDGQSLSTWEEEGVESTKENIHSDALLNILALTVFIFFTMNAAYESLQSYGWYPVPFSIVVSLPITLIFIDRGVFSWITYLEKRHYSKAGPKE